MSGLGVYTPTTPITHKTSFAKSDAIYFYQRTLCFSKIKIPFYSRDKYLKKNDFFVLTFTHVI